MELKEELIYLESLLEKHEARTAKLTRECNLGRRFLSRTFENFNTSGNEEAFTKAKKYADRFCQADERISTGLLFIGNAGTGKTHLAAAIMNHLIAESIPAMFITSIELYLLLESIILLYVLVMTINQGIIGEMNLIEDQLLSVYLKERKYVNGMLKTS